MLSKLEERFQTEFHCQKCDHTGAATKVLSLTGTGLSRLLDVQMYKFLFVSCKNCGYTEIYNQQILEGKSFGAMDILDILLGR